MGVIAALKLWTVNPSRNICRNSCRIQTKKQNVWIAIKIETVHDVLLFLPDRSGKPICEAVVSKGGGP
jgi:hypothetical protein